MGFTPELMNLSATYLQMSYRICITSMQIKPQRVWQPDRAMYVWQKPTATNTQEVIIQLEKMKDKRMKILKTIQFQRNRTRFPIPEAIYTAKWVRFTYSIYTYILINYHTYIYACMHTCKYMHVLKYLHTCFYCNILCIIIHFRLGNCSTHL